MRSFVGSFSSTEVFIEEIASKLYFLSCILKIVSCTFLCILFLFWKYSYLVIDQSYLKIDKQTSSPPQTIRTIALNKKSLNKKCELEFFSSTENGTAFVLCLPSLLQSYTALMKKPPTSLSQNNSIRNMGVFL